MVRHSRGRVHAGLAGSGAASGLAVAHFECVDTDIRVFGLREGGDIHSSGSDPPQDQLCSLCVASWLVVRTLLSGQRRLHHAR